MLPRKKRPERLFVCTNRFSEKFVVKFNVTSSMSLRLSSFLLLLVLSITDAYLLAHPNLVGRLGILLYKHSYIKTFPRALLTVLLVVGISVLL